MQHQGRKEGNRNHHQDVGGTERREIYNRLGAAERELTELRAGQEAISADLQALQQGIKDFSAEIRGALANRPGPLAFLGAVVPILALAGTLVIYVVNSRVLPLEAGQAFNRQLIELKEQQAHELQKAHETLQQAQMEKLQLQIDGLCKHGQSAP